MDWKVEDELVLRALTVEMLMRDVLYILQSMSVQWAISLEATYLPR